MVREIRTVEVRPPDGRERDGHPVWGHRWYDVDLELQALAVWEDAGRTAASDPVAPQAALEKVASLIEQDRVAAAQAVVYALGGERLALRPESLLRRLFFHLSLNRYAAWGGDQVRFFSKHPLHAYRGPVPPQAHALLAQVRQVGVRVDEAAVLRDETWPDPVLAVRVADAWFALYSWE